jgi:hypothetical protein
LILRERPQLSQVSSGLGFLILCNRIFWAAAGLTPATSPDSGPERKKARHFGDS